MIHKYVVGIVVWYDSVLRHGAVRLKDNVIEDFYITDGDINHIIVEVGKEIKLRVKEDNNG